MYFAACVFSMNKNGEVLAVSRKDNKDDFGLPGGKVEPGETPLNAALRELLEETGFEVSPKYAQLFYHAEVDGKLTVTYDVPFDALKKVKQVDENETGLVTWVAPDTLAAGSFGNYNRGLFKAVGIKLKASSGTPVRKSQW